MFSMKKLLSSVSKYSAADNTLFGGLAQLQKHVQVKAATGELVGRG